MQDSSNTWILHELEAFICKALKGEAIVYYAEPLKTKQMEASGSPFGWKLMRKKIIIRYIIREKWTMDNRIFL